MERVFTDNVGKHKKGERHDYPRATWDRLAKSVRKPLHKFTMPVDEVVEVVKDKD